jgi:hypothetical protein
VRTGPEVKLLRPDVTKDGLNVTQNGYVSFPEGGCSEEALWADDEHKNQRRGDNPRMNTLPR